MEKGVSEKDLKIALRNMLKEIKEMIEPIVEKAVEKVVRKEIDDLKKYVDAENKKLRETLLEILDEFYEQMKDTSELAKKNEEALRSLEQQIAEDKLKMELQFEQIKYSQLESTVRIMGLREHKDENLKEMLAKDLAPILNRKTTVLKDQIDKAYRVNMRNNTGQPRHIVVHFTSRTLRNDLIQASFKKETVLDGQKVAIFKEIPQSMVRRRREFFPIAQALRKENVAYRWNVPSGLSFMYKGKKFKIQDVKEATDFMQKSLGVASTFAEVARGGGGG